MLLRNSERQTFKKCRHRWEWTYLDGRQSREAPTALRFGDLVHQALERYYKPGRKRGPHPAKTFRTLYNKQAKALADSGFDVWTDDNWAPALDLGAGMLEGYVERYAAEDQEYEVISSEQTFQLGLTCPARPIPENDLLTSPAFRFKVVGTFDGVWRHLSSGRLCFKEFKTASAINTDGLALDEQAGLYWTYGPRWLRKARLLPKDGELSHILYTFLRKAVPDPDAHVNEQGHRLNKPKKDALLEAFTDMGKVPKVKTVDGMMEELGVDRAYQLAGEVSKVQPAEFFERIPVYRDSADRERMHNRVLAEARDIKDARDGHLALYKNPGPLYMPNCRGCSVREACEVHEAGGDFMPVLNATMRAWDPYAAHELPERQ